MMRSRKNIRTKIGRECTPTGGPEKGRDKTSVGTEIGGRRSIEGLIIEFGYI